MLLRSLPVSIMILCRSLPHLAASHRDHEEGPVWCEVGQIRRTQSAEALSGSRGREKLRERLTKARSGSKALSISEDEPVAVYYLPRAFEQLPELKEAA